MYTDINRCVLITLCRTIFIQLVKGEKLPQQRDNDNNIKNNTPDDTLCTVVSNSERGA